MKLRRRGVIAPGPLDQVVHVDPRSRIDFRAQDDQARQLESQGVVVGRLVWFCQICGNSLRARGHGPCRRTASKRDHRRDRFI